MALLQTLGTGQGHLKAGFLGFQKSGKTYTAMLLAIGTRKFFGLQGPIAMFDTEGGSEYINKLAKQHTGLDLIGVRSRSLDDLIEMGKECLTANVSVLLADSVTHPWTELCEAYLAQVNTQRAEKGLGKRHRLEFQDWGHLKRLWAKWTDFFLNAPMHIIVCGRAGYIYDFEENEETGKKDLIKTGIKMKTEGEFGFEPSLLVEMERVQSPNGRGGFTLGRQATVIGDRFSVIDGETAVNPKYDFFAPHVELLTAGAMARVDTRVKTETGVDQDGDDGFSRERKLRAIFAEEIQGELAARWPGQTAAEKKAKTDIVFGVFKTRSWTAVENMDSRRLKEGLDAIRSTLGPVPAGEVTA